ncbi:class I SAM-dependent methyltransferase [Botrimarina hoheduenensis]|uniref:Methyltransferase domain protein n=1 Tax=Botrimarina hoheduenensis TaxID=2528000 RepID=A0A5C5W8J7_9BACT|nr:class I SAM-dependent methyltransferase [Botrimarina hoheduenensis]TWT46787.1 hypothetical protein Pla111_18880 [Botrimarina hoheduenensis]
MRTFPRRGRMIRALPHNAVVVEIGVNQGEFSQTILSKTSPRKLHLIDCWEEHHEGLDYPHDGFYAKQADHQSNFDLVRQRFAGPIATGQVAVHRGYSVPMLETLADASIDWVYVDANHSYEAVAAELAVLLRKVKPGGVIAGHDYISTPYWKERNYGVVEAVDEFCWRHGWELIGRTTGPGWDIDQSDNPSFAIRQKGLPPLWSWSREWLRLPARRAA